MWIRESAATKAKAAADAEAAAEAAVQAERAAAAIASNNNTGGYNTDDDDVLVEGPDELDEGGDESEVADASQQLTAEEGDDLAGLNDVEILAARMSI